MKFSSFYKETILSSTPERDDSRSEVNIIKTAIGFYLKYSIFAFILIVIILLFAKLLNLEIQNINSLKGLDSQTLMTTVLWMSLLGPFLEEIMFRLWNSFKRPHLFISVFVLVYFILTKYLLKHEHTVFIGAIQTDYFEHPFLKSAISFAIASCIFLFKSTSIKCFSKKYGKTVISISVYLFALIHLTNIRCEWYLYPLVTCMCFPQFVLGLTLTNLRLKKGFWTGVIFHCTVNLFTVLISDGSTIIDTFNLLTQ